MKKIIRFEVVLKPPIGVGGNWQSYLNLYVFGRKIFSKWMNSHPILREYIYETN